MKTKEFILPDNWEVKEVVDNKIIVGEKEEKVLPKTWQECLNLVDIELINRQGFDSAVPSELEKPLLALCQLLVCRNAWWKKLGWSPNWNDTNLKYCISCNNSAVTCQVYNSANAVLAFPTKEVCVRFLESFRDFIEEAKELL